MNNYKIIKKSSGTFLGMKSQKGQQLNLRDAEAIKTREVEGLIPVEIKYAGSNFKLNYNITGFISLTQSLRNPINKNMFAFMLDSIYSLLQSMQSSYFNHKNLLLDFRTIMVNPATKSINFIYIPIQYFDNGTTLRDFFLKIAHDCVFLQDEDTNYVREYINILNKGINYSEFELEEYIKKISGKPIDNTKRTLCPKCGKENSDNSRFCASCGSVMKKSIENKGKTYNPLDDAEEEYSAEEDTNDSGADDTTVLGGGGTTVLGSEEPETPSFPHLVRSKTEEEISVNKPQFRLGREKKYSDYHISDNSAISRGHADIVSKNGRYFIVDNNSVNRTYVDDRAIAVNTEIEIFDGTTIKLANEEFIFNV